MLEIAGVICYYSTCVYDTYARHTGSKGIVKTALDCFNTGPLCEGGVMNCSKVRRFSVLLANTLSCRMNKLSCLLTSVLVVLVFWGCSELLSAKAETLEPGSGDAGPVFAVKEIRIGGNKVIGTDELLGGLPKEYVTSDRKGEEVIEQSFDFGIVHEILDEPGEVREVSLRTIQGLTRYILSVYQQNGFAGIYVYVPAEAIEGGAKLTDEILPIEILEGKVAAIEVERFDFERNEKETGYLRDSVIESWSPVKAGEVVRKKELDDYVKLLNLNPDRYVERN